MGSLCLSHYRRRFICEAARRPSEPRTPTTGEIMGGAALASDFHLPPIQPLSDKFDERNFNESVVFLENDPDRVRTRAERDKPCDQHIAGGRYEIL